MNLSRWGSLVLLLLQLSCVSLPKMAAQQNGAELAPPQKMRVCANAGCLNLTWAGEYYEARLDGQTAINTRFWIKEWTAGRVELYGKTAFAADGVFPAEGTYTGRISPAGNNIIDGRNDWRIGYSASGTMPFTLTWDKQPSHAAAGAPVSKPAHRVGGILVPAGASDVFASYPDVVRAILLPEYALAPKDAKRACHDPYVLDANTALEIARFAYRAADIPRGNCWLITAAELGSTRARVIYATTFLYGWAGTAKDEPKGFGMLKLLLGTRDPWDIWILNQCYIDGTGTPKDAHQAAILASYALMHDDVYQVSQLVGSDNAALVRESNRLQVLMDPPMKSSTACRPTMRGDSSAQGKVVDDKFCTTTEVVDQDALQRRLNEIDAKYAAIK